VEWYGPGEACSTTATTNNTVELMVDTLWIISEAILSVNLLTGAKHSKLKMITTNNITTT